MADDRPSSSTDDEGSTSEPSASDERSTDDRSPGDEPSLAGTDPDPSLLETVLGSPEANPEADLPDPETELPNVPSVDVPEPPRPTGDVPPELLRDFWTTVVVFNVALLSLSVGAMMLAFGVERSLGVGVFAVGLLSLLRGYRKYRAMADRQAAPRE